MGTIGDAAMPVLDNPSCAQAKTKVKAASRGLTW